MRYEIFIALRYLFSKKKHNTINLITWVSMIGVAITTAALIAVLSVLNGFENVVQDSFSAFDPELKIVPAEGKFFSKQDSVIIAAKDNNEYAVWSEVLEQDGLISYNGQETPALIKGVDDNYTYISDIDSLLWDGSIDFNNIYNAQIPAALGIGLAQKINVSVDPINQLALYAPKNHKINLLRPDQNFTKTDFICNGIFCVDQIKYDDNLIIFPIKAVRNAYQINDDLISSIEIRVTPDNETESSRKIKREQKYLQKILGDRYVVLNRHQQQADFYRISKIEKWTTFMILSFILLIATFNIIGSLSMIIIEKKEDISLFKSIGATSTQIKHLFTIEGFSISVIGAVIGNILGISVVLLQQYFGIIKLGSGYLAQVYPVELQLLDILSVIVIVLLMGYIAALYTSRSQLKSLE